MSRSLGSALIATSLLVAVAILGYVTGHGKSESPLPRVLIAANSMVTIQYPGSWGPMTSGQSIPGLTFEDPLRLAPHGDAGHAGLLAGRLAETSTTPLPPQLVSALRQAPSAEVVGLRGAEAFRYREVKLAGFDESLTLYSIPASTGNATAVACYAPPSSPAYLRECDRMVAALVLNTQINSNVLVPSQAYAKQLEAVIGPIDSLRVRLRAKLAGRPTRATVSTLATRLAAGIASPLSALGSAQPPPTASAMHLTLIESLTSVRDAYTKLADAARLGGSARYAAAREKVDKSEARFGTALGELHLIGY